MALSHVPIHPAPRLAVVLPAVFRAIPPDVYDLFEEWFGEAWGSQKLVRNFIIDESEPTIKEIELW